MAYPELREEILATGALSDFEDRALAGLAAELCGSGDEQAHAHLAQRLSTEQQSALSAQMMDPSLESAESARRMLAEYRQALTRWRGAREVKGLVRAAASAGECEATATAHEIIMTRREQQKTWRKRCRSIKLTEQLNNY